MSSAKPGRNGGNLKASDFRYSRKSFWITSRESPDVVWIEEFKPSDAVVKAYVVKDKDDLDSKHYLDASDSFDNFLQRFRNKTLTAEYKQVPIKHDEVGMVFPHIFEIQDLFKSVQSSDHFKEFLETGEQDLQGFEGDMEDEVRVPCARHAS